MKIKFIVFSALFLFVVALHANPVSSGLAAKVGFNFWYSHAVGMKDINTSKSAIVKTYTMPENGTALYYIFDISPGGFVIVAADDAVIPVLGYSFEGYYQANDQPEVFADWMNNYRLKIMDIRDKKIAADKEASSAWNYYVNLDLNNLSKTGEKGVDPLLTTKWDQGNGYNYHCPAHAVGPGGKCYAGCVATAMAQVMKFWNFPEQGIGSHSYYHPYFGTISADFSATTYDWTSMTNTLNSTSKEAISTLIFHCGVAVDMNYSPLGSSSQTSLAAYALKNYFHYRLTLHLVERLNYTLYDWRKLIMGNLDDGKPILYSGSGSSGGHAWVCDGYQDTSHFHMNWGWSGANNGYFALDNLNSGNGDFTAGQEAVLDIIPYDAPYCLANKVYTAKSGTFGDGSEYSYYWNNTNCDWLIQPDSATDIVLTFSDFKTEAGKDFLSIYDGVNTSAPLLGTYSGYNLPPVLHSSGGSLLIVFTSDGTNQDQGWEVSYTATVTGTDEYDLSSNTVIYPNPVHSSLNLHANSAFPEDLVINITTITGQLVESNRIIKGTNDVAIDVSGLSKGIYLLSLVGQRSHYNCKIAIQ